MAADADAGLMDVRVRLAVRAVDDLLDVDSDAVGVEGEVVGEGDVDVAVGRVGDLAELGRFGAAHLHDLGVQDGVVEVGRSPSGFRPNAADQLGIGRQVGEHGSGVETLRRECHEEVRVGLEPGGCLESGSEPTARVADG